jgi:hypothetical protein
MEAMENKWPIEIDGLPIKNVPFSLANMVDIS